MATRGAKVFIFFAINLAVGFIVAQQTNSTASVGNFTEILQEYLNSFKDAPSLIEVIAKIDKDDGIEKYKLGLGNEDKDLNITQLISKYGYKVEEHNVITCDGYILTMYRIPCDGPPVLVMHGILESADDYVTVGPNKALSYLLSNAGYDVWLGNARGTNHSRKHVYLSPENNETLFYNYSFHEIGYYDLPAMIDYILDYTCEESLSYVGHSMGTTSFFVMCSERPEYNKKIKVMVALSAVVYLSHVVAPFLRVFAPGPLVDTITAVLGFTEVPTQSPLFRIFEENLCGNSELANILCSNIVFAFGGFDYGQINVTNTPVIFGHTPSGASMKQIYHYGQGVSTGQFRQYDYGEQKNLQMYGTSEPPEYKLGNVNAPVAIFYSKHNDWLSAFTDVKKLTKKIQNVVQFYKVPDDKFTHADYLWAKDVDKLVYKEILKLFNKYNKCNKEC